MIDLHRFLENPFDDRQISLAELLDFSGDHLARMIANNAGGELTARITATASALTLVESCATSDQTKKAVRKARVQVKTSFRESLSAELAKIHGAIVSHFGPNAAALTECFPEGRTVFSECEDDLLAQKIETLENGVTVYVATLGAPLVAQVHALVTTWDTVNSAAETASGNVSPTQEAKRMARENLQLMLFLNLLKLGEMWARQPAKLDVYMQQSRLENPQPAEEEEEPAPPPAPPGP